MFLSELPPSLTASTTIYFHLTAFLRISRPLSPCMTSFTRAVTSSLVTTPFPSLLTRTPILHTSAISLALVVWSVHRGITTIGTPKLNASRVEFHPPCVTKPPTARWERTSSWLHQLTISPSSSVSSEVKSWGSLLCLVSLTTHRKLHLQLIRLLAISFICSFGRSAKLPNDT